MTTDKQKPQTSRQRGAAALEYILVSSFAAIMTLVSLGILAGLFKKQLEQLKEEMTQESSSVSQLKSWSEE